MNEHDFCRAWEQVTLSPEADARIQKALESACSDSERKVTYMNTEKRRFGRKISKTAIAIIAAALLLTVTALAVASSRIKMDLEIEMSSVTNIGDYDVEIYSTDEEPVKLGYWYPKALPDGFESTYISLQHQNIHQVLDFENELGDWLRLIYEIPQGYTLSGGVQGEYDMQEISVNGGDGYLFTRTHPEERGMIQYSIAYWLAPEKGIAFSLEYKGYHTELDIVAFAESVAEQKEPLIPTQTPSPVPEPTPTPTPTPKR